MPTGYANGLQTNFRYVLRKQVRCAGIGVDGEFGIDDARLDRLIVEMSHWINRLTDQWFLPLRLIERVDGGRGAVARMPNLIPIIELFSLKLEKEGLFSFDFPNVAYQVKQRYVMMSSPRMKLPDSPHLISLDGVFGWLVDETRIIKTRTTLPMNAGDTIIKVVSTAGFRAGEAILAGDTPEPRMSVITNPGSLQLKSGGMIVEEIVNATDLKVEPLEIAAPAGVSVSRYGRVPDMIQRACLLMIRDRVQKVGDIDTAESPFGIGTRLNSESVEGYSYSLGALPAINGFGGGANTTGNVEVDDILSQFTTPAMYIGNV
jgi:hypothetical protein